MGVQDLLHMVHTVWYRHLCHSRTCSQSSNRYVARGFFHQNYFVCIYIHDTVDGFIFMGSNVRGFNRNGIFVGIKIRGNYIFLQKPYRKSLFHWFWNSWIGNQENLYPTKIKPFTVYILYKTVR